MSLPPNFLDELRVRTPLSSLIGRKTRLTKSGRNWKGCCPFHGEKTPSFYVYDDHYHCFGCGAHGDAIAFVMQSEGSSFPEAVERLAGEAGLEVPKPSREQSAREARAKDLHAVMVAAAETFRRRLRQPEGRPALDYLRRRGLTEETIEKFGLGWAGQGRGTLMADLKGTGITEEQLLEVGLLREPRGPGEPASDLFFNRVMFPIKDRRGRIIAFGGRILGDGQPKYVNSPETPLFSKRRNLYALDLAREAAFKGQPVVAVEGYMDVIALHQAGFGGALAPLGTALTEEQLAELWRLTPEPILCFDGDDAGGRAASRAAEVALKALSPEHRLAFATLPKGEDPDTLVKKSGAAAFEAVLNAKRPIEAVLYDMAVAAHPGDGPADRAALKKRLMELAGAVEDKGMSAELRGWLLDRFFASRRRPDNGFGPKFGGGFGGGFKGGPGGGFGAAGGRDKFGFRPVASPQPRPHIVADATRLEQARCLMAILIAHPWLLQEVEEAFGTLDLPSGHVSQLRTTIFAWLSMAERLDSEALVAHLQASGAGDALAWVLRGPGLPAASRADAQPSEALDGWWHFFGFLRGEEGLRADIAEAVRELAESNDPAAQQRLMGLKMAHNAWLRGEVETTGPLE
ncbi:DNA primase [Acetobacteraceae bacterium H6797]|nr:DNA primase [Acetobacteraceae bacterium H6797]